jgi:tetratricopeptide (TPR) repeat protein
VVPHSLRNNLGLATLPVSSEPAALGNGVSGFSRLINIVPSNWRRLRQLLPLALVVVGLLGGSPSAQELSTAERTQLLAQKEALFQKTLSDPGNLDTAFAYADVSAKLGDNEAAVSALERMLLFNPNLPRVQLELGTLYFRMGSYEIARTYFDRAAAANPPEEVKERIGTYLAEISRASAPQRFSGYFSFGAQYQSDANLAGASSILGINLLPQFVKQNDVNVFGTGAVLYSYDLGTQSGDTIEVSGTGFANHYSRVTRLDLGLVETSAGPRFNFSEPLPWVRSASLKPYLIANDASLGGNQYFHTLGTGGEATALVWQDMRLKSVFEFRQKNFNNAPDRPLSRGFNGSDKLVSLSASKPITAVPDSELSLEFDFLDQDTRLAFYTNKTYAGSAAYRIRYDDPTGYLKRPLETTFSLTRSWANFDAADPCCGVTSNRFDRRWRFGITQSFPVSTDIAVVVQLQRDIVSSNVPLFAYTNNSLLVGPQFRF